MFKNLLKTIFRSLVKNKTFSLLNIFGLAVGIACAGLIFLWVENEVTFDNNNAKKDKLYVVLNNQSYGGNAFTNWSSPRVMASAMLKDIPGVTNTCRVSDDQIRLLFAIGDKKVYASGLYADPSIFSMFTLPFVKGNAATAFKDLNTIVITQQTAKKFFGTDDDVIGKTIRVGNSRDYVVTGVIKNLPENSTLQCEWLASYNTHMAERVAKWGTGDETAWDSYGPFIYAELADNASLTNINRQLYNYIHSKKDNQTSHSFLFPMNSWHLHSEFANGKPTGGGKIEQVRMLSLIAWIILLIACINFMNLSTARSERYAKEVGIRKVLGSSRKTLVARFIAEAICMAAMAGVVALLIMVLALPAFNTLMQKQLSLQLANPVHIGALLLVIIISGLLAGSYPSLYLSSFKPVGVLKGFRIKTGSAAIIRKGLVVLQFTVSVVFIISTFIIYKQVQHAKNRKLGFDKKRLVEIDMQTDVAASFPLIKQHLFSTGTIQSAAMTDHVMMQGGNTDNRFKWQDKPVNSDISITFRNVTQDFVQTYGMHVLEGRDFATTDNLGTTNVIINKSFAQLLGRGSAVGKIIQSPRGQEEGRFENLTVIGVVDDYVYGNAYENMGAVLFMNKPIVWDNFMYVKMKPTANAEKALADIEAVLKKDNPAYPLQYKFVDEQFDTMFKNEVLMSTISSVFATLAIIISCLGLFGLAAYTAEQRIKEIGIRKVLGASVTGLAALLSKDFLQLVGISCLISFPVAGLIMHNWLKGYEYRIGISWWVFVIAGMAAVFIAVITISFQTVKAAMANPVKALRNP